MSLSIAYSSDLILMFRLNLPTLSITYSSELILMFRLTYQHTVYNLLFRAQCAGKISLNIRIRSEEYAIDSVLVS
jgi:hypothetical protein